PDRIRTDFREGEVAADRTADGDVAPGRDAAEGVDEVRAETGGRRHRDVAGVAGRGGRSIDQSAERAGICGRGDGRYAGDRAGAGVADSRDRQRIRVGDGLAVQIEDRAAGDGDGIGRRARTCRVAELQYAELHAGVERRGVRGVVDQSVGP